MWSLSVIWRGSCARQPTPPPPPRERKRIRSGSPAASPRAASCPPCRASGEEGWRTLWRTRSSRLALSAVLLGGGPPVRTLPWASRSSTTHSDTLTCARTAATPAPPPVSALQCSLLALRGPALPAAQEEAQQEEEVEGHAAPHRAARLASLGHVLGALEIVEHALRLAVDEEALLPPQAAGNRQERVVVGVVPAGEPHSGSRDEPPRDACTARRRTPDTAAPAAAPRLTFRKSRPGRSWGRSCPRR